ncbi:TetR family transcriptional regulator [Bacteroidia bacterium]|nr:TetR family transcriptional regulator [Bacteroidia bacterium]
MELKDRIIENATTLFFQKGIRSITMSDIANEMGISKRTLYEVFRDKEELLEECVNYHMGKADREIKQMTEDSKNVVDALMLIYAKHLREAKDVNKSVIHDLKKYHSHIYEKIECRQKEGVNTFMPLFQRGREQGLLRDDVNFEILLWLLKSQFKALMEDNYIPTDKYSADEFIRAIILNFIRGISTPMGNERVDKLVNELNR